jgi:hypothetical protein
MLEDKKNKGNPKSLMSKLQQKSKYGNIQQNTAESDSGDGEDEFTDEEDENKKGMTLLTINTEKMSEM